MVIVTGATGHIGNVLVRQLLARGEDVRVLIHNSEDITPVFGLNVDMVRGNVCSIDSLLAAFKDCDMVYHLAGVISIMPGNSKMLYKVNTAGTQNVVDACIKTGVRRLVYTSSIHAVEEPPCGTTIDESITCNPDKVPDGYGRSKALATAAVLEGVERGLDAVIIYPTGVTGPFDYRISEIGQLIIDFLNGNMKVYIDGAYDFVDVRDVARGIILAGEKGIRGESYILSGEQVSVHRLLSILHEVSGIRMPYLKVPTWLAHIAAAFTPFYYRLSGRKPRFTPYSINVLHSNSVISSDKARQELGFSTRPVKNSIADAVRWFHESGYTASPPTPPPARPL
jgi:dihydroflavonol-4-reductase